MATSAACHILHPGYFFAGMSRCADRIHLPVRLFAVERMARLPQVRRRPKTSACVELTKLCRIARVAREQIAPLLGEERSIRRTNQVLPQARARRIVPEENDEVITTSRPSVSSPGRTDAEGTNPPERATPSDRSTPNELGEDRSGGGMMQQWMSEFTGAARPGGGGGGTVRVPSDAEIQMLTGMFPDIARDVLLGVLQRRCVLYTIVCHVSFCP